MMKGHEDSAAAERHARLRGLFFQAVSLDGEERSRFVAETCGDDAELRDELEALLESHQTFETPVDPDARDA